MDTESIRTGCRTDRICHLPCNMIDEILKYLPLDDAVRTSILSREWRYKWVTIPHLVFDLKFTEKVRKNYDIDSIAYRILSLHKGPIVKFTFEDSRGFSHRWFHFLSNHRIEELTLCLHYSWNRSHHQPAPGYLFTLHHLKHLKLWYCDLIPPSTFKGFDRLVRLDLRVGHMKPPGFTTFISKCPMLAHLSLDSFFLDFQDFEIDAPNLKSFSFSADWELPSICFKNTPLLEEVSITWSSQGTFDGVKKLIEFCGQLSSIKNLKLNRGFLKILYGVGIDQKLPSDLSHLIVLRCDIDFRSIADVSSVVCLIRSSPNLQRLEIESWTSDDGDMKPAAQFLKEQQNYKLSLSHLENVNIVRHFKGLEPEMEFVKLILSTSTSLIKLKLDLDSHLKYSDGKRSLLLEELAKFSRASSKAGIFIS